MNRDNDILIAEDERKLAALEAEYLHAAGFTTRRLDDGDLVVAEVRARPPSLLLLDLMLPNRDGLDICRELRSFSQLPIIMLTARAEEIDRLLGLELGADDYICKPFSPREMVARVKALLRRQRHKQERQASDRIAGLTVKLESWTAELDGHRLELTPVEFRLLETLASHPGRVFSRALLLERIYDDHRIVSERTIDSHMKNLRRKLAKAAPDRELLESVYGVGYRLEYAEP